jgi:hypothetical protein
MNVLTTGERGKQLCCQVSATLALDKLTPLHPRDTGGQTCLGTDSPQIGNWFPTPFQPVGFLLTRLQLAPHFITLLPGFRLGILAQGTVDAKRKRDSVQD